MNLEDLIDMFPDIEPFLIRKWHYAFYTFFDLIGNDVIEWRDFQQLIDAIGAVRGVGGEDHIAARISLTDVWHSMCETMHKDYKEKEQENLFAADHAGRLDRDVGEFTHSREGASMAEGIPRLHVPAPRRFWQVKNFPKHQMRKLSDQLVDLSEYVEVLGYFSIPREDAIACFDKFAVVCFRLLPENPAGGQFNSIDYKRFLSLWQQYFRSTDINDVGNHLLGTP
ncbi:hypothetical protein ANCDUO_16009 [Ancylostoma duodenale]|uniref:EF-hand domain-containing protein n=1 Tax=Ancylostoma duodenale TaxID=51022 RepID=A0A0C2FZ33_9BILA|nr:hypothetical protein ANCDUO_16009 [Ancylostoma duodenale]